MNTLTRLQQLINKSIDRLETQLAKADDPTKLAQLTISLQRIATTAIRLEKVLSPSLREGAGGGLQASANHTDPDTASPPPSPREGAGSGLQASADRTGPESHSSPSPPLTEYDPLLPPLTEEPSRNELSPVLWMLSQKKLNPNYRPPDNTPRHMLQRYHQLLGVKH